MDSPHTNGFALTWRKVWSGVPQGSVLGLVLFNTTVNDLDEGTQGDLIKFVGGTKLGEANTVEAFKKRLEYWAEMSKVKFNRDQCKVLHLGKNNPRHRSRMGTA